MSNMFEKTRKWSNLPLNLRVARNPGFFGVRDLSQSILWVKIHKNIPSKSLDLKVTLEEGTATGLLIL